MNGIVECFLFPDSAYKTYATQHVITKQMQADVPAVFSFRNLKVNMTYFAGFIGVHHDDQINKLAKLTTVSNDTATTLFLLNHQVEGNRQWNKQKAYQQYVNQTQLELTAITVHFNLIDIPQYGIREWLHILQVYPVRE